MQRAADQRRAPRGRLAALLAALVAALVLPLLLSAAAHGQSDPCPILDPDCVVPSTTTTTEEPEETTTTEEPEETSTTARTSTTQEEVTTSTLTVTTLHDVLIPGDGTAGAESTTTTAASVAGGDSGISDETLIMAVVGALGIVAVVVAVLTWRYWNATRPRIVEVPRTRTRRSVFLE